MYRSINRFFSMVTRKDYSCDVPQKDQGFGIKFPTGKGGICNAKKRNTSNRKLFRQSENTKV